jgi:hypothetical protein
VEYWEAVLDRVPSGILARLGLAGAMWIAVICGFGVGVVSAAEYEQVDTFASAGEEVQLGGVGGLAVNVAGTSGPEGAPPGALYAATKPSAAGAIRIARFSAEGEFELAWQVTLIEGPYERCGPKVPGEPPCSDQPGAVVGSIDVDVDQVTGYVYVLHAQGSLAIAVYKPDGSKVISRFGATGSGKTEATPERLHSSPYPGGLAVNALGEVYVFDLNPPDNFYHRLMVFKPQTPGDYEHYVYAGQGNDIGAGASNDWPSEPMVGASGNVFVSGYEGEYIEEYDPALPNAPICEFKYPKSGITGYAVNRVTDESFFYTAKGKRIHQLGPCVEGKFPESGPSEGISVEPERDYLYAMAINPSGQFSPARPAGILYAGAPGPVSDTGGEPGKTSLGYAFAPSEENPPVVGASTTLRVGERTAELQTVISPKGFETRYTFQYLSRADYEEGGESFEEASEVPPGGAIAGSGQKPLMLVATLSGLEPDTAYVYRTVASSKCSPSEPAKVCEAIGAVFGFRTFPPGTSGLPDGRAYELVSPSQKNGGQVLPADPNSKSCAGTECKPGGGYQHFPMQSSPSGNTVVYEGTPFTPADAAVIENEYISRRSATGWETVNLTPPALVSKGGQGYKDFDAGLGVGLLEQTSPSLSPDAPPDLTNLYRQPSASPQSLSPLLTTTNAFIHRQPGFGSGRLKLVYAGSSADFSRVFFEANDSLTIEAGEPGEETNLYEWSSGALRQVNLAPGDTEALPGAVLGSGELLGSGGLIIKVSVLSHAISSDGTRVFWTSKDGRLFVRVDGGKTVEVPSPGSCDAEVLPALRVCFLTASADGSVVLLSNGQLYELSEETGAYEAGPDLSGGGVGFEGIAGQSEDLSHVYFVDTDVLTGEEENDHGAKAQAGKANLYSWDGGANSFIATLLSTDNESPGDWQAATAVRTAEASPAGRYLTFASGAPLTGYDNTGPCVVISGTDEFKDGSCREVFLFDSAAGRLICPSCSPSNARPLGPSGLRVILNAPGSLPQPRYLTDSGRLYFDSQDALVPADTNGRAEDVYQFEPLGVGGCERGDGCVSLISGGRSATDSNFLAIDATGDNLFFTTRDRLVPADADELIDLYDARVEGGFPSRPESPSGEVPAAPVPLEPSPSSAIVVGSGNVTSAHCKKGQVKRNGRCVKRSKKAKKSGHGSRKHERGGAR